MIGRAKGHLTTATFATMLLWSPSMSAQIVNTEPLFRNSEKAYSLLVEGSVERQEGNTEKLDLELRSAGRYRKGNHEGLVSGALERESESDRPIANKTFGHVRYRYYLTQRIQGEVYFQAEQDLFRLMTLRALWGVGPRFIPVKLAPLTWTLGVSTFYEVERLAKSVDFAEGTTRRTHRLNVMSSARINLDPVTLHQVFYLQPAWRDFSNARILHLFEAELAVSKHISVKSSLVQALDTIAPSSVRSFDNTLRGSLKLDF